MGYGQERRDPKKIGEGGNSRREGEQKYIAMIWARGKDARGALAEKDHCSFRDLSTGERNAQVRLVRWGEKYFSCQGFRLAVGNVTRERKEYVERTCDGVIELTQSFAALWLHVKKQ